MDLKFKNMKKLIMTAVIATMFSVAAFAADGGKKNKSEAGVSTTVLNHFAVDFSEVKDAVWTVSSNSQKATFVLNAIEYTAFYDLQGEFLGTTNRVSYDIVIPAESKETIAKKYAGYEVSEVIKFAYAGKDSDVSPIVYFIDLKKGDKEVVLRTSPGEDVAFYKQIK